MSYYPSQGSYAQPVVYASSRQSRHGHYGHGHGRHHHSYSDDHYPEPVRYVPSHSSHGHGRHHSVPPVTIVPTAPIVVQPSYSNSHGRHHRHHHSTNYYPRTFGESVRHFFGLAPRANYRYKSNRSSWGFMGYSRRPRYYDGRSGGEVDKYGRPIYRV